MEPSPLNTGAAYRRHLRRKRLALLALALLLALSCVASACAGSSGLTPFQVLQALLGGGTLAAGGGGMAAGAAALGAATLGIGLLVGGIIFNLTGGKLSDKADEAQAQVEKAEETINSICEYLVDLCSTSNKYYETLSKVNEIYERHLNGLKSIVTLLGHTDWNTFAQEEKRLTENTVLLVGLLYNMCKVELVLKSENESEINTINKATVEASISNAYTVLADKF